MFWVIGLAVFVSSCGKDDDSPPTPPTDPQAVDSLPSSWVKASTPSDTTHLVDIFFQNNTTGYAVGSRGEVWKSGDGGLTWSFLYQLPEKLGGYNLSVTPNGKVYIVLSPGGDGIYISEDGTTFQRRFVGRMNPGPDVYFTGNDTGYISGAYGTVDGATTAYGLWQTTDGGARWQLVPIPGVIPGDGSHDFAFYDAAHGYMLNNGSVCRTGGQPAQWSVPLKLTASVMSSIAAPAERTAYAVDYQGVIYKSTDGGAGFTAISSLPLSFPPSYINLHFVSEQTGYAAIVDNILFKTADGGLSWRHELTSKNTLDEVHFTDAGHGWVCGDKGTVLVYRQ